MAKFEHGIKEFISAYVDPDRPIIIGLSGGADSLCLFHLLHHYSLQHNKLFLHVAHVDHGWREESKEECRILSDMCSARAIPFHSTRLSPDLYQGNLEDLSRKDRLLYFASLAKELNAQGVFLAHHADDQAETVFKRVLEGTFITNLQGMMKVSCYEGLTLFRPMLAFTKKEILQWLEKGEYSYFNDPTNHDVQYLRARMRKQLFPTIEKEFGKSCTKNLCVLAEDSLLLHEYMKERLHLVQKEIYDCDLGCMFDITNHNLHTFELMHLLRSVISRNGFSCSREEIKRACQMLIERNANKRIPLKNGALYIDRGRLFCIKNHFELHDDAKILEVGQQWIGNWHFVCRTLRYNPENIWQNSWENVWSNSISTYLPLEGKSYSVLLGSSHYDRVLWDTHFVRKKDLSKWLNDHKVPHFLTSITPRIVSDNLIYEDFLTGYHHAGLKSGQTVLYIEGKRMQVK